MMSLHLNRLFSYGAVAFLAMSLCVGNAAGQSGVCVVNTQYITFDCQTCDRSGCSCFSMTKLLEPGQAYGTGQLYQTQTTKCCSNTLSYINNPSGTCIRFAAPTTLALGTRRVFVRGCGGRFRLVSVAV